MARHETWCDRRQHALAMADAAGPTGCVGRYIQEGTAGGWIADDSSDPSAGSRFIVDWAPAEGWSSLRPEEAAELGALLARLLGEYRQGDPAVPALPSSRPGVVPPSRQPA